MSGAPLVAGVEIGGTKCIAILGRGPDKLVEQVRIDTRDPERTLGEIKLVLDRWQASHGFSALGIASFGPLCLDRQSGGYGTIVSTPKPGWSGTDVLRRWQGLGVPVALQVDVVGAALAEGRWGAAQGLDDFAYITVGTGIGVGPIVAGRPIAGLGHCELGHARVPRLAGDDWPGSCPYHGDCVEGLASGPAIEARAGTPRPGNDWEGWASVAHALAMLVHNLFLGLQPRRVLIGGGVVEGRPRLLPAVRERLAVSLGGYHTAASIAADYVAPPGLGDQAGPLGALALALRQLKH